MLTFAVVRLMEDFLLKINPPRDGDRYTAVDINIVWYINVFDDVYGRCASLRIKKSSKCVDKKVRSRLNAISGNI